MANANGDLMQHSFLMMGIIVIVIYLAVVLIKMAVEKIQRAATGKTGEQRRAEKIMAQVEKEDAEVRAYEEKQREKEKKQGKVYENNSTVDR